MFAARCPHCRSVDLRRVGVRNSLEQAIYWILLPYRCSLCGRHCFLFRWLTPADNAA
jgi:DNA-directed RNA polymerase subunit RPC12/RpoP